MLVSATLGVLVGFSVGYLVGRSSPEQETDHIATGAVGLKPSTTASTSAESVPVGCDEACLAIVTWNVRGYPETEASDTTWFDEQIQDLGAGILCIQEIANDQRVATFLQRNPPYTRDAFANSARGQDNAILATESVGLTQLDLVDGFRHPPQIVSVSHEGFDAVVVTVHLSWEPVGQRVAELAQLENLVAEWLTQDPDVLLVGDFNLQPDEIEAFAERIGFEVLYGRNQLSVGTLHSGNSYDYFLISPDLASEEAHSAEVITFAMNQRATAQRVSDHRPVRAHFLCDEGFRDRPPENP